MHNKTADQIVDAVFQQGEWQGKRGRDRSLRAGFQNLQNLGAEAEQVRQHHQLLRMCGSLLLAQKFASHAEEEGAGESGIIDMTKFAELPLEFDLERRGGFKATDEDGLDRVMRQHFLDSAEFVEQLRQGYHEALERIPNGRRVLLGLAADM